MILLNPIQYKFWLDDKLKYPAVEYNDTNFTFAVEGNLSLSALQEAYRLIMLEYPPFHSRICVLKDRPYFDVDDNFSEVPFWVVEKGTCTDKNEIIQLIKTYCLRAFNLSEEYPCRFYAIHSGNKWFLFHLFHHIVMDGISLDTFFKRLSEIYNELLGNVYEKVDQTLLLEEFNTEISERYRNNYENSLAYWKDYLSDGEVFQSFPIDPEIGDKDNENFVYTFGLGGEVRKSSIEFVKKQQTTFFRLLAVTWSITLAKFLQTNKLALDHAFNLRPKEKTQLLGTFVNNLSIQYEFSSYTTILDLLKFTDLSINNEREYGLIFYHELFSNKSDNHLYVDERKITNVGLLYTIYDRLRLNFNGCITEPFLHFDVCLSHDFVLQVEQDAEFTCRLRHLPKYSEKYVASLAESFRCVLLQILENPSITFGKIELVSKAAKCFLLEKEECSLHAADSFPLFLTAFKETVKNYPDHIAVSCQDSSLTYAVLDKLSSKLARILIMRGIYKCCVAISMPKCLELIVGILGIMKSGNSYVPIDAAYPKSRIDFMLTDCEINFVLVNSKTQFLFPDQGHKIEDLLTQTADEAIELPEILPSDNAYVIYTSGTTGKPKGIPIKHSMLAVTAYANAGFQKLNTQSKVLQFANICFDGSVMELFPILESGGTLVLPPEEVKTDAVLLMDFLEHECITSCSIPPVLLSMLPHRKLKYLVVMMSGGDVVQTETLKYWSLGRLFINSYGPTENAVDATNSVLCPDSHNRDIGTSVPGTTCYVLDDTMKLMPDYAVGELYLGGVKLTEGYINRPELNQTKFVDNPYVSKEDKDKGINTRLYRTGDLVMRRSDGHLIFIGRSDNQVKLHGYRIELGDIESKILGYNHGIKNAVVILHQHNDIKQLVAYLLVSSIDDFSEKELRAFLREQLPEYMIPSVVMPLNDFPFNTSGKVDKKRLPAPVIMLKKEISDPLRTATELKIATILNDLLGISEISRSDSLLSLGADSVSIIMLALRIEEIYGYSIRASEIYSHILLKDLAAYIDSHKNQEQGNEQVLITQEMKMDRIPLSPSLLSLYMQCAHSDEMRNAYNLPCLFECPSSMKIDEFVMAFNQLVQYRDSFRISFPIGIDGLPYIHVSSYQFVPVEVVRISNAELRSRFNEDWSSSFDLEHGPLFRCRLYHIDGKRFVCSLIMHHLVSDGWSAMLIQTDLLQMLAGKSVTFSTVGYVDYVIESSIFANSEIYRRRLDYWRTYLNEVSGLQFLSKQSEVIGGTYYRKRMPKILSDRVLLYCREHSYTPYLFYGGVYLIFLSRVLRQEDFVSGVPFLGREKHDFECITGYFIHTLPWRFCKDYNSLTFSAYLKVLHHCLISGEENAVALKDIEQIVRDAGMDTSLVQTMFSYEKASLSYEYMEPHYVPFNLALTVLEHEECADTCLWEYSYSCFSEAEISVFSDSYLALLEAVLDSPDYLLSSYSIVPSYYVQQVMTENTVAGVFQDRLVDVMERFQRHVQMMPFHPAVVYRSNVYTYQELSDWGNQIASQIRSYGVHPGCRIGICMENSACCVATILGVLMAGGCYVPIDVSLPLERKQFILSDASCCLLIEDGTETDTFTIKRIEDFTLCDDVSACEYAYIIYTSGTTGKPKGIPVTHRALAYLCKSEEKLFCLSRESRVLQFASISFDASVTELFTTLTAGATMVIATLEDKHDPNLLADLLENQSITCATIPPALLPLVPHRDYPYLHTLIVGGESVSKSVVDEWSRSRRFINAYGPTENTVDTTMCIVTNSFEFNDIGTPLPGVSCYVLDEQRHLLPPGVIGELYIGGLQLTDGYLNRPDLNFDKFVINPYQSETDKRLGINARLYRSGDLVRRTPEGAYIFMGRVDNQVKLRGFRIELSEIEAILQEYAGVNRAVVQVIRRDEQEDLAAYIQPVKGCSFQFQQLVAFLRKRLPAYMLPGRWAFVQEFPLTVNGKIDYRRLPQTVNVGVVHYEETVVSHDEQVLLRVAREVLGESELDVQMDLLDAGMNSLYVMDFVSRISDLGYRQITISQVYQKRSIRALLESATNRFYFWATEDNPQKPLMVLICGYPYFSPFYGDFIRFFKNDFSIFVFESYHEYFLWKKDISLEILFQEYRRVLDTKLRGRKIEVLTGYCMGSELAVAFANYLEENSSDFMPLRILNMEGIFQRPKDAPMPYSEDLRIRENRRITDILTNEQKPMIYSGEIIHCMAGQFSNRVYLEGGEENDKELLKHLQQEMQHNWEQIRSHYPNAPFSLLECTHWNFFEEKNLQEIKEMMSRYWGVFDKYEK